MKIKISEYYSDDEILNESTKVNLILSDKLLTKLTTFFELNDTPNNYIGQAGRIIRVNSEETGIEFSAAGAGDMNKLIYDPNLIEGDVFDMDNMVEGTTNLILNQTERDKLSYISVTSNVDLDTISTDSHVPVTVTDSTEIDFTLTGQDITASLLAGSIDETKLDSSVNASLDLADNSIQPLDNISELTNDSNFISNIESESIGDLSDVDLTGIANDKILKYNSTTSKWEITDDDHTTYTAGTGLNLITGEFSTNDSEIDHNSLNNTHNLTTDIDHNSLNNTHNLTTDIDHNTITNNKFMVCE